MACAPSEDSDQPQHPPSLIRVFAVRMKKDCVLSYPLSAQRSLWSDWADAQADLSLRWAHSHFVGFVMWRLTCALWQLLRAEINPYLPNGLFHSYQLDESIRQLRGASVFFMFILFQIEINVSKQCRPWSDAAFCASGLGLHCLPRPHKMDAMLIWVKFSTHLKSGSSKIYRAHKLIRLKRPAHLNAMSRHDWTNNDWNAIKKF